MCEGLKKRANKDNSVGVGGRVEAHSPKRRGLARVKVQSYLEEIFLISFRSL